MSASDLYTTGRGPVGGVPTITRRVAESSALASFFAATPIATLGVDKEESSVEVNVAAPAQETTGPRPNTTGGDIQKDPTALVRAEAVAGAVPLGRKELARLLSIADLSRPVNAAGVPPATAPEA